IDPDNGRIAVMQPVEAGHHVQFMQRDRNTVGNDLVRAMVDLRNRIIREQGSFSPQAALYISCAARVANGAAGEMALVGQVMDGVPLVGFYAGGEISNRQLYGYTGILIVFL
ncbi:MAG TPA: FIST C-terminal domain-containing protein, partial [Alphaproteobacteria bacterium]